MQAWYSFYRFKRIERLRESFTAQSWSIERIFFSYLQLPRNILFINVLINWNTFITDFDKWNIDKFFKIFELLLSLKFKSPNSFEKKSFFKKHKSFMKDVLRYKLCNSHYKALFHDEKLPGFNFFPWPKPSSKFYTIVALFF